MGAPPVLNLRFFGEGQRLWEIHQAKQQPLPHSGPASGRAAPSLEVDLAFPDVAGAQGPDSEPTRAFR